MSFEANPSHAFVTTGVLSVTLTVTDVAGNTTTVTQPVDVIPLAPPVLTFSAITSGPTNATLLAFALSAVTPVDCGTLTSADLLVANGAVAGVTQDGPTACAISVTSTIEAGLAGLTSVSASEVLSVADPFGNAATSATGSPSISVDRQPPAVTTLALQGGSDTGSSSGDRLTKASTLTYDLVLSESVSGLGAGDFAVTGTATGCSIGDPAGSGATWTVALTGCSEGTLVLRLKADTVSDAAGNTGPASAVDAPSVTVDRTAPSVSTLRVAPSPAFTTDTVTVTATLSDPRIVAGAQVRVDTGGSWADISAVDSAFDEISEDVSGSVGPLSAGDHEVCIRGADGVGNRRIEDQVTQCTTLHVSPPTVMDTVPPVLTVPVLAPDTIAPGGPVTIQVTATDAKTLIASAEVKVGGGDWQPITAVDGAFDEAGEDLAATIVAPTGAERQVCVRATDTASPTPNTSDGTACATLTINGAAGVTAGTAFTCAALADLTARCWGANDHGQLGDRLNTPSALPVTVPHTRLDKVASVVAGATFACALLRDGTVACWGDDAYGQLGDSKTTRRLFATPVWGLVNVMQLTAGATHACALLKAGTVKCWGRNASGQLGDGTTMTRKTPVKVPNLAGVARVIAGVASRDRWKSEDGVGSEAD